MFKPEWHCSQRLGIYTGKVFSAVSAWTAAGLKNKDEVIIKCTIALCPLDLHLKI